MGKIRHYCLFLLLIAGIYANPLNVFAQQVNGITTVDSLKVGDKFTYSLLVRTDKIYDQIIYPDSSQFGNTFQINSLKKFKKTDYSDSLAYSLQFFGLKDTTLGPLTVEFISGQDTVIRHTLPISVYFKSEIKNRQKAKFQPLKPIYQFAIDLLPYLIILLIVILLSWYGYKYYKKRKALPPKPKTEPVIPGEFIDPLEELEKAMMDLQVDPALTQRDFKYFYSKYGDTIREYFEHLYQIPALEYTTRELIRDLDSHAVDSILIDCTNKILRQADMVKFAKFDPTLDLAHKDLETGQRFLSRAREVDRARVERMRERFEQKLMEQKAEEEPDEDMKEESNQE